MKALGYLTDIKEINKIALLTGEDDFLKLLVTQTLIKESDVQNIEKYEVKNFNEIPNRLGEGSLFGRRLILFDVQNSKLGKTETLITAFKEVMQNQDLMIIRTESFPITKDSEFNSLVLSIECEVMKNKKSREKFLKLRLNYYGLDFSEEAIATFLERTEATSEMENALLSIKYAYGRKNKLKPSDIEKATAKPEERNDLARALITGNSIRISKQIKEGEPILVLTILHNNLLKLYTFLEMMNDKEAKEEEVIEILS